MSNWECVVIYNEELQAWLSEHGYAHPIVSPHNRMPTTGDMKWALTQQNDLVMHYPKGRGEAYDLTQEQNGISVKGFDWSNDTAFSEGESFFIQSTREREIAVLSTLSRRCGQLIMWPDSGAPALLFQSHHEQDSMILLWDD